MAKKKLSTNKGPKGKKARVAAKLDRQWGEEVNEEERNKARIRKGKRRLKDSESRIKSKQPRRNLSTSTSTSSYTNGYTEEEDEDRWNRGGDDDDADDDDSVDEYGSETDDDDSVLNNDIGQNEDQYALSSLLKNIGKTDQNKSSQRTKGKRKDGPSDDASYDESSEDDDENESNSENEDVTDEESDDGIDVDQNITQLEPIGMNPFHLHFNQEPLPEDNAEPLPELSKMKKVRTEHLNPSLVLQLSGKALAAHKNKEDEEDKPEYRSKKSFSHVRKLLMSNWNKTNRKALRKNIDADVDVDEKNQTFSSLQDAIYTPISSYCDAQITCANRKNVDAINNAIALHIMNHVLTANNDITTHNNQIRDMKDKEGEEIDDCKEWRDQGYTRPKVLVLLPTKSTAHNFVNDILKLLGPDSTVENLEQFDGEFGNDEKHIETDERTRGVLEKKGQDWNELFADHVNSDDDFKVGLAFSKKKIKKSKKTKSEEHGVAVKLFSDFYYSDIIIASPLGLKMCITTDEEEEGDADFLSSIDILVSLQSDVMLMQNWDHVVNLMERINQQPKKSGKTDFSRVRNYLLLGQAARWKQFIMVSRFSDPHLLSTFNKTAKSLAGRMKLRRKVAADEASICNVMTKVRQVFQRVPCESFLTQGDKRLKYFSGVLLPQLIRTKQNHTLIYIPSYFDFVALRNILLKHDIASSHFVSITEYSRGTEVSRGRARFLQGRKRIMLYTGRAHFFMRHHINGAKHLIMFGLPEHAEFYPELLNMLSWRHRSVDGGDEDEQLDVSAPASCLNLFTKYEAQNLERIVGTKHSDRMVKGEKSTFLFSS